MNTVPRPALLLGFAGLLPTLGALVAVLTGDADVARYGFVAGAIYGITILSFLGGAWWGIAASRAPARTLGVWLALSVVPSLAGTLVGIFLSPLSLILLGVFFLLTLVMDRALDQRNLAPDWWMTLRVPLSVGMALLHISLGLLGPAVSGPGFGA